MVQSEYTTKQQEVFYERGWGMEVSCEWCGKAHRVNKHVYKAGRGRFCSQDCFNESRRKRIKRTCLYCRKPFEIHPCEDVNGWGRFCSISCAKRSTRGKGGSKNPRSRGIAFDEWSRMIKERDNYTCQSCGTRGGLLHSHHIKSWKEYPALRFDLSNGITLCADCHRKTFKS